MTKSTDIQVESAKAKAISLLQEALVAGPVEATVILTRAKKLGISKSTLIRAKKSLGVVSMKSDFTSVRLWEIPTSVSRSHKDSNEASCSDVASDTHTDELFLLLLKDDSNTKSNKIATRQMALTMWHQRVVQEVDIEKPTIDQIQQSLRKFAVREKNYDSTGPHFVGVLAESDAFLEIVNLWIERGDTNVWGQLRSVMMNLGRFIFSLGEEDSPMIATTIGSDKAKRLAETIENVKTFKMLRECEDRLGVSHGYFTSVMLIGVEDCDRRLLWPADSDEDHLRRGKKIDDIKKHMMMAQNVSVEFARSREERILAKKGPPAKDLNNARTIWSMLNVTSREYAAVKNRWVKLSNLLNSLGIDTDSNQIRLAKLR